MQLKGTEEEFTVVSLFLSINAVRQGGLRPILRW